MTTLVIIAIFGYIIGIVLTSVIVRVSEPTIGGDDATRIVVAIWWPIVLIIAIISAPIWLFTIYLPDIMVQKFKRR